MSGDQGASGASWQFEPVLPEALEGSLNGPVWLEGSLLACRPDANEIVRVDPVSGAVARLRHSTSGTSGLAQAPDGRLYGTQPRSRRVVWYEAGGETFYLNAMLDGRRHNDPQDLAVDPQGRIWFSDDWTEASMEGPVGWPPLDHHSVLRLTRIAETADGIGDWALERMTVDTHAPRGVAIEAGGRVLIITDRGDGAVEPPTLRSYPIEGEVLGPGRVLLTFGADGGLEEGLDAPAGLCLDARGRIILAVSDAGGGPGSVIVVEPDGRLVARHRLPAGSPTNAALGGADGRTLYVTTAEGQVYRAAPAASTGS